MLYLIWIFWFLWTAIGISLICFSSIFSKKLKLQTKAMHKKEQELAVKDNSFYDKEKTLEGLLLALFLGVSGLIVGICVYPENTISRSSFLQTWLLTFGGCMLFVSVFVFAFVLSYILS